MGDICLEELASFPLLFAFFFFFPLPFPICLHKAPRALKDEERSAHLSPFSYARLTRAVYNLIPYEGSG